jgi:hypothetical protein
MVKQGYYNGVTMVLPWFYSDISRWCLEPRTGATQHAQRTPQEAEVTKEKCTCIRIKEQRGRGARKRREGVSREGQERETRAGKRVAKRRLKMSNREARERQERGETLQ